MIPLDDVLHFDVILRDPESRIASDADSTPQFDVFEEDTDTPILADQNMTKRTSLTGHYRGSFTVSAANGFEPGKWYSVVVKATVNSYSDKDVSERFRVGPAEAQTGYPKVDTQYVEGDTPETAGSVLDEALSSHTTAGTLGKEVADIRARLSTIPTKAAAVVDDAGNSATVFKTDLTETADDHYTRALLKFTSGALSEQVDKITGYNGTTKVITVQNGFTAEPAADDTFEIIND